MRLLRRPRCDQCGGWYFWISIAGRLHLGDERLVHLLRADPVEQDVHLDAGARALGQGIGELLADRSRPVDVGLEVDRLLGAADRREHRREDPVAVDEHAVAVAVQHRRPEQHAHRVQELRVLGRVEALDLLLDLLLAALRVDDHEHDQRRDDAGDDDGHDQRLLREPAAQLAREPHAHARVAARRTGRPWAIRQRASSDRRRVGLTFEVAMASEGGDEGAGGIARSCHHEARVVAAVGQGRGQHRPLDQRALGAEGEDRLAVAVLVLEELDRLAVAPASATPPRHRARRRASNSTDGAVSIVTSTCDRLARRPARTRPRRAPTKRGTAPAAASAAWTARSDAAVDAVGDEDARRGASRCCRRPAAPAATAPASSSTSGVAGVSQHRAACGSGTRRCRGPRPRPAASSATTLASIATTRSRIAGACTLVSSKRNAPMMCAFSIGVWLFAEQRRLACSDRRTSPACRAPCRPSIGSRERRRSRCRRPGTGSRRRASSARRRRGRGGSPGDACRRAGCCAPGRPAR